MKKFNTEDLGDLKKRTTTSVLWSIARVAWSTFATFIIFVVLARLLGPAEFGLFALASLFLDICRIFASAGLGDAVMRHATLDEDLADTAFWANFGLSSTIALIVVLVAPIYAASIKNPAVTDIIRSLALTLPVGALGGIHGARLSRDYQHKAFAIQSAISSVASGALGIIAAMAGLGVWSLVVQAWTSTIIGLILVWLAARWVPRPRFSFIHIRSIWGFSLSMTTNQILWLLMSRVGDFLIGRTYGPAELGRYRIAWRMYELIGQLALAPIGGVAMLTFSKLQNDPERLQSAYYRILSLAGLLAFPLMFGFAALAEEIIQVLFSNKWQGAAQIAQILSLMAVPFVFNYISPGVLAALNKAGSITKVAAVQLVLSILLTWISLPFGLLWIGASYVFRTYLTLPYQQLQLKNVTSITFSNAFKAPIVPLLLSIFMALTVWASRPLLLAVTHNVWGVIFLGVALGAAIYVAGLRVFGRALIWPLLDQLPSQVKKYAARLF